MPDNKFIIEVTETGTGRTKGEIVSLFEEAKAKASEASQQLNKLKQESIKHAEATSTQASAVRQLNIVRAREIQSLKDLQQASIPHVEVLRTATKSLGEYQRKLSETTKEKNKLTNTTNADANRLLQLSVQEKSYQGVINTTKGIIQKSREELDSLGKKKQEHIQSSRNLSSQIITERAALSQITDAQQANNQAKQKAQLGYNALENKVRTYGRELKNLERNEAAAERETRRMDEATLALANTVGYAAYNAIRNFIEQIKDFIVNATIYASRTDEMRLAMLNMSKQSGVSRGQLLLQSEAMQRMNITTQETYTTLTKFQLAQLDVTKATQLARVAQDLAVIAGVETGEEVNRLVHGITTLQIRVLRTAGVFVSLEQSMKEAALAQGRSTESFSEAEKQQILLNKVLEVGSRATGNYEKSLDNAGKRMRSMVRIFQDMQNAVGGLLLRPFGNLVDILSGLMTLVSAAPKIFALLTIGLIALGVQIIRNLTYTSKWIERIRALILELRQATAAALGLTTSASTQSGVIAATTSRWQSFGKALLSVVGIAGRMILIVAALNAVTETFAQISKAAGGTTKFTTEELKNQVVTVDDLRKAQEHLQYVQKQYETRKQEGYADKFGRAQGFGGRLEEIIVSGLSVVGAREWLVSSSTLQERLQDAQDDVDKLNAKLYEQGDALAQISAIQREYSEQVAKAGKINLDFSATSELINLRLERLKKQFEQLREPVDTDTGLILTMTERLNVLKPGFIELDTILQKAATSQEDYNRMIQQAEESFPGFITILKQLRAEGEKYIEGVGEAEAEAARRFVDIQRRLRSSLREIYGLFGQGNQQELRAGNLELLEKRLQIVRQEIDSINDLRINLNRDVGQPIPQDREARVDLQATYETAVKVRDEVRAAQRANKDFIAEIAKAQKLAADASKNAISAERIAAKLIADNQVNRVQNERQVTAEIIALTKERMDAAKDEAGTQRQAFGQFYKEQLENLVNSENATRRLNAELAFMTGQSMPGLTVPEFGLGSLTDTLENIVIPAATQAENVATITTTIQEINGKLDRFTLPLSQHYKTLSVPGFGGVPVNNNASSTIITDTGHVVMDLEKAFSNRQVIPSTNTSRVPVGARVPGFGSPPAPNKINSIPQILKAAGWPENLIPIMSAIAIAESSGNTTAHNAKYPDDSYGLWQINRLAHPQYSPEFLRDPVNNAKAALQVYNERGGGGKGLSAWTTFTKGTYKQHLGQGYDLYAPVTSPALTKGVEGTSFPQTGQQKITNLTPAEILIKLREEAKKQEVLSKKLQQEYVGSETANVDFYGALSATSTTDLEEYKKNETEIRLINERTAQGFYDSEEFRKSIFTSTENARKKISLATHVTLLQLIEDEKTNYRESAEYKKQTTEDAEKRIRDSYNESRDTVASIQADQRQRTEQHEKYITTIHNNAEAIRLKSSQNAEDRYNQMLEERNSGWRQSYQFLLQQQRNFEVSRYEAGKNIEDNISELKDRIQNDYMLDPLKLEQTRLEAVLSVKEADTQAKASMITNSIQLADAQIYHATRANARVMEYLAEQRSVDQIVADSRIQVMETIFSTLDSAIGRITVKLGIFGDIVKEIIVGFARIAASKVFLSAFGLTPTPTATGTGAGLLSTVLGSFTGGTSGTGGATSGNLFSQVQNLVQSSALGSFVSGAGNGQFNINEVGHLVQPAPRVAGSWADFGKLLPFPASGKKPGILGGISSAISSILPFAGAGVGYQLGGQSTAGSILGGAGGLLAGLSGAALLGSSSAAGALGSISTLGGLLPFALPVIPIAAGLIVGAIILKKNKEKRENEKKRTVFMNDSLAQLTALLSSVRRDRITGEEALAQAASIRAQYLESSQALSDSKTRNIALKDVSRLDLIISQIKAASKAQERRRELDEQLVPEFAAGGRVSSGRGGIVPGTDLGYDNVLALLRPNEVVINQRQQRALGGPTALARAGVPGFVKTPIGSMHHYDGGGYTSNPFIVSNTRTSGFADREMNIYIVTSKRYAEQLATQGKDKIMELTANDIKDKGKVYAATTRI